MICKFQIVLISMEICPNNYVCPNNYIYFLLTLKVSLQKQKICRTEKSQTFENQNKYFIFKSLDLIQLYPDPQRCQSLI